MLSGRACLNIGLPSIFVSTAEEFIKPVHHSCNEELYVSSDSSDFADGVGRDIHLYIVR